MKSTLRIKQANAPKSKYSQSARHPRMTANIDIGKYILR